METKVKVDGFENTEENNKLLQNIIAMIYPLTPNIEAIEVGKSFTIIPFSRKTDEEHVRDIISVMHGKSKNPF